MRYFLENEQVKAEVESFGAELKSIVKKEKHQEYMWEADPAFWGKTSPILFPFIGKLEGAGYFYQGKHYEIEKHGFARDMEFQVLVQEKSRIVFGLESTKETFEKFPFPFALQVEFSLQGNKIRQTWSLKNNGQETMYFSVGGHPAFACPLKTDGIRNGSRTDCFVKIHWKEEKEEITEVASSDINVSDGLLTGQKTMFSVKNGVFPVTEKSFEQDAIVLENNNIAAVGLCNAQGEEYIRLEADCPVWGIWSMPQSDASYICIEPWWGICDCSGYQGQMQERPYTNKVNAEEVWKNGYEIYVL